jgi:pentose-5-phosphate-3-epimerase
MNIICPTVLAKDKLEYTNQLHKIIPFAERIQIDLKDGIFAVGDSVAIKDIEFPNTVIVDLHIMYKSPHLFLSQIIKLKPSMVIVHAESDTDIPLFASELRTYGIKTGLAILQETKTSDIEYLLPHVQHVLIFSGNLGHFGGRADLGLLAKIQEIKEITNKIEFGWDGGVNELNASALASGGVEVLNVGGAIQNSDDPEQAYYRLCELIK